MTLYYFDEIDQVIISEEACTRQQLMRSAYLGEFNDIDEAEDYIGQSGLF